ncbi:hypothetical protein D9611_004544 [Ephemerocybe angulata]|uniref:Uncharacterized protein n=2 Tax=Ephemerocybe angulata TaxID=980116 RepID=A0A8H5BJT0_9AGAR|nr:hypothetical protein D9611_004544 [Tulosesus angulatus]KAF6765042.1 hypothetical protein DFP72DRAFT_869882 [Tulosesus angulatus]
MTLSHELNPILVAPRPVNAFSFARSPVSTSPSPSRSAGLPSDALEEFLAILKPSPSKARRSFQYDRALVLRSPVQKVDDKPDKPLEAESHDTVPEFQDQDGILNRWLRHTVLSSPVSRMHTRNPFLKHIAELPAPPLSPAAVPLPTPSPNELLELEFSGA